MTHDELAHNLATHLLNDNRMVWEDIPAGRAGSIRPDVYTIEKSFSKPNPISYEIKVSKSDFLSDVTKGKWSGYLDFSYGVVFAVPKGLITKKEIPDKCGLITFNGEFWNTVKRPVMEPKQLDTELLLKLLISGKERQTVEDIVSPRELDEWKAKETLRNKFGKDFATKISLIEDYPKLKEQVDGWYKSLYEAVGKSDEYDPTDRFSSWSLNRMIEDTIKSCDKQKYLDKILTELDNMKRWIENDIERCKNNLK